MLLMLVVIATFVVGYAAFVTRFHAPVPWLPPIVNQVPGAQNGDSGKDRGLYGHGLGNTDQAKGFLYLVPASASIHVGEEVMVRAYYQAPSPACAASPDPCLRGVRDPEPREVNVSLASSDSAVARLTCPPESARPTCIGINGVSGVSPGKALVTATYTASGEVFTAVMNIAVLAASSGPGR